MDQTISRQLAPEIEKGSRPRGAMESLLDTISCDICGSTRSRLLFRKRETRSWWVAKCADDARLDRDHEFAFVRCSECRHVYVNPRLKPAINDDIYARYWRSHEPANVGTSPYGGYVCRQLATLRPRGDLLDFGSGWGSVLNEAERAGWRATGIEVDERKIAFCREQGLNAVYGDLLHQPFAAATFDAAIAEQVFEHLYSPVGYMKELHRVLRPDGVLYVAVPNFGSIAAKLRGPQWSTFTRQATCATSIAARSLTSPNVAASKSSNRIMYPAGRARSRERPTGLKRSSSAICVTTRSAGSRFICASAKCRTSWSAASDVAPPALRTSATLLPAISRPRSGSASRTSVPRAMPGGPLKLGFLKSTRRPKSSRTASASDPRWTAWSDKDPVSRWDDARRARTLGLHRPPCNARAAAAGVALLIRQSRPYASAVSSPT